MHFLAALLMLLCVSACGSLPPLLPPEMPKKKSDFVVPRGMQIVWVPTDNLAKECGIAVGCYRIREGICYVFTRHATEVFDTALHATLGHEVRHCFDGDFHGSESQIVYMNRWRKD